MPLGGDGTGWDVPPWPMLCPIPCVHPIPLYHWEGIIMYMHFRCVHGDWNYKCLLISLTSPDAVESQPCAVSVPRAYCGDRTSTEWKKGSCVDSSSELCVNIVRAKRRLVRTLLCPHCQVAETWMRHSAAGTTCQCVRACAFCPQPFQLLPVVCSAQWHWIVMDCWQIFVNGRHHHRLWTLHW